MKEIQWRIQAETKMADAEAIKQATVQAATEAAKASVLAVSGKAEGNQPS